MALPTLLVVDDDREFLKSQTLALQSHFKVLPSESVQQSLEILESQKVDCALVDYFLNDGNGHDIARWVAKNRPACPIVLISARLSKNIAVESFEHRIFDVLEKPYSIDSALQKLIRAVKDFKPTQQSMISEATWSFDAEQRVFRYQTVTVLLTQTEVRLLEILIAAKGKVVPRNSLIQDLWGDMIVAENTLDTHLTNLRKKAPFLKSILRGVRGVGYILDL